MKIKRVDRHDDHSLRLLRHDGRDLLDPIVSAISLSFELEIDPVQGEAPLGWFSLAGPDRFAHVFFARASLQHSLLGVCREDDRRLL